MRSRTCVCGHARETHEHFRPGSDCGACGSAICPSFRPAPRSGQPGQDASPAGAESRLTPEDPGRSSS